MQFPEHVIDIGERLKIVKDGSRYILPVRWALSDAGTFDFNVKLTDRAFTHGSYATGDKKLKGKTLKVEFGIQGRTEEEHDDLINLAYIFFTKQDYELQVGREDRCYKVSACQKITHKYEKGFKQRYSNITVSLLLADPFRYETVPTVLEKQMLGTVEQGEKITFINPSSAEVPLIWEFAPEIGTTVDNIKVIHQETGQSFSLKDSLLTGPAKAIVNAEKGTVRRDEGNSLNTFSGIFLQANPGENNFFYNGGRCRVKIAFTPRYYL